MVVLLPGQVRLLVLQDVHLPTIFALDPTQSRVSELSDFFLRESLWVLRGYVLVQPLIVCEGRMVAVRALLWDVAHGTYTEWLPLWRLLLGLVLPSSFFLGSLLLLLFGFLKLALTTLIPAGG